jgi:hypothetical protein
MEMPRWRCPDTDEARIRIAMPLCKNCIVSLTTLVSIDVRSRSLAALIAPGAGGGGGWGGIVITVQAQERVAGCLQCCSQT